MIIERGFNYKNKGLDWFLDDSNPSSALNNDIYEAIININDSIDLGGIFDDAYLLCLKVINDKHPENNFAGKYTIPEEDAGYYALLIAKAWLQCLYEDTKQRNIKRFIACVEKYLFMGTIHADMNTIVQNRINRVALLNVEENTIHEKCLKLAFHTDPIPESKFLGLCDLDMITNNYEVEKIEELLEMYKYREDKLLALDAIYNAFTIYESNLLPF